MGSAAVKAQIMSDLRQFACGDNEVDESPITKLCLYYYKSDRRKAFYTFQKGLQLGLYRVNSSETIGSSGGRRGTRIIEQKLIKVDENGSDINGAEPITLNLEESFDIMSDSADKHTATGQDAEGAEYRFIYYQQ